MKKLAYIVPFVALFSASVATVSVAADTQGPSAKQASAAIYEAIVMNNKAHKAGFEWRDTYKKLLGPAKKAYKKGDYGRAIALANKARAEAEMGLHQAKVSSGVDLRRN